jgi:hypothetical protein
MKNSWSPNLVDMAATAAEKSKKRLDRFSDYPILFDSAPAIQINRLLTGEQTLADGFPFLCLPHYEIHKLLADDVATLFDPIDKLMIEVQVDFHKEKKRLLRSQNGTSMAYVRAAERVRVAGEISWLIANNPYTRELLIKNGFDQGFFAVGGCPQNYRPVWNSASYVEVLQVAAGEMVTLVFRKEIFEQIEPIIPGEKWEFLDPYDRYNYWKRYRSF